MRTGDRIGGTLHNGATFGCDLGERCPSIARMPDASDQALTLETIDGVGDTCGMDLQADTQFAKRQAALASEGEQDQRLVPSEGQAEWFESSLHRVHHDPLDPDYGRCGSHSLGFGPTLPPMRARFHDRVEVEGWSFLRSHRQSLTG